MKCFVIAMEKEAAPIIAATKVTRDVTFCGKRLILGELYGERIGIVICGVGKVNAAMGTQIAVDELGAQTVINIGVAGGLYKELGIGTVYEISHAVQYDFDLTAINGTALGTLDECKENYLPLSVCGKYPAKRIATADRFSESEADFITLTKTLNADVRDMECAAVAQVCMHARVKCCAFKIISDVAGGSSTAEQYKSNLALCFATLAAELQNIIKAVE